MALILTPEILRATYDLLTITEPFCKWNLPDGEDVKFKVVKNRKLCGWHEKFRKTHTICISQVFHGRMQPLLETMAHEMVHVHQWRHASLARGAEHGVSFKRYAAQVCKIHGFDLKLF